MYAVIRTGGKQYKIEQGSTFNVERLAGDVGQTVEISEVLLLNDGKDTKVGTPLVDGASVKLEIVSQIKGPKVRIFKKIRRQGKQLTKGHRQPLTSVKVAEINA